MNIDKEFFLKPLKWVGIIGGIILFAYIWMTIHKIVWDWADLFIGVYWILFGSIILYILMLLGLFLHQIVKHGVEKIPYNFKMEKKTDDYYREIIKEYTPTELSYVHNGKIESKKDFIATVLILKLKNKINIFQNKIEILDKSAEDLNCSERYVLNTLINLIEANKKVELDVKKMLEIFEKRLFEDMRRNGLVENKKIKDAANHIALIVESIVLFLIGCFLVFKDVMSQSISLSIGVFFMTLGSCLPIVGFVNFHAEQKKKTIYTLSKKGNKLHQDLMGLKMYLKDYSMMSTKGINELELWDEYMIYSVILNDNKKVQDDVWKIFEEQFYL